MYLLNPQSWFTLSGSTLTAVGSYAVAAAGLKTTAGLELTAGGTISSTNNADISIVPNGTGITKIGDATAYAFSSPVNDDLSVSGRLGVKGTSYFGTLTYMGTYVYITEVNVDQSSEKHHSTDLIMVRGGPSGVVGGFYNSSSADKGFVIHAGIDGYGNNAMRLVAYANRAGDYGHATMLADPTFFVFSRTAAGTATDQWGSHDHDTANYRIRTGKGAVEIIARASAPTLGTNGSVAMYLDEGTNKLKFAVRYSDTTLKTGEVALA